MNPELISTRRSLRLDLPIFILGITERSGTNFLFHLLCLHPDCHHGGPIWENYLTLHLDQLVRFAESAYQEWNPEWKVPETLGPSDTLLEDLGNGLAQFLHRQMRNPSSPENPNAAGSGERLAGLAGPARRLVTKTPSVRNLAHFFRVFPQAPLLILVRDGRAVVESGVRTFGLTYEWAMRNWANAGREILRFLEQPTAKSAPLLLVRYEDLFHQTEKELRRIFAFLGLAPERYDFSAPQGLPVVGSSDLAQRGEGKVHWRGEKKDRAFDPTKRWQHWSPALQDRFEWIAGDVLRSFGYPVDPSSNTGWRTACHKARDLAWSLRKTRTRSRP